jgi:membrane-bound serine protease (ClpP class)
MSEVGIERLRNGPQRPPVGRYRLSLACCYLMATSFALVFSFLLGRPTFASTPEGTPVVVEVNLDDMVQPISSEYVRRGIARGNEIGAQAVLLEIDTPGGLESSMREIIAAIIASRVPVIAYVAPAGARAASAGLFILLSADVAVMAPGTHAGAAHPVILGAYEIGKTMEEKLENDSAAYIRSLADRRGRNSKLAEEGVRTSRSYTEKEALEGHLIDAVLNTPQDIFAAFDGKTIKRFDGSTTTLHLAGASIDPYVMTDREKFLFWLVDPNIAFLLGALGVACLWIEFTHPGMVLPGVAGAIAIVLALFAFHLLPVNYAGVVLILMALAMFGLEAKLGSHGVLAVGGIICMLIGALILVNSPLPGGHIRLATALGVTLPLAVIMVVLLRLAIAAKLRKAVTGKEGLIDEVGIAETELGPGEAEGRIRVRGEIWNARADQSIHRGAEVTVRKIDGLTLRVEPKSQSR